MMGSRDELWYCMRWSGVAEKYVRVVEEMHEDRQTVVRSVVEGTDVFKVGGGVILGISSKLSLWSMIIADNIVIFSESKKQVEENLETQRYALERR